MNLDYLTFILYTVIAVSTTMLLGRILYRNGVFFLARIFRTQPNWVFPINTLLLIGFYLVNLGFVFVYFSQKQDITTSLQVIEFLSTRLGTGYLLLGSMHLFNILVLIIIERNLEGSSTSIVSSLSK